MILIVNNQMYSMDDKTAANVVQTAKDSRQGSAYAIIAIQKKNTIEMKNEVFETEAALMEVVEELIAKDFKVTYTKRTEIANEITT